MYCMKCGKQIEDTADFCKYCGAALKQKNQSEQSLSGIHANMVSNRSSGSHQSNAVVFVIVGLLVCLFGAAIYQTLNFAGGRNFAIEGSWKSVGDYGFGQAQPGAVVIFDGTNCNFFSPNDTYAFYQENGEWRLDCTSMLFSDTMSFQVEIEDNNNIDIYSDSYVTKLKRIN